MPRSTHCFSPISLEGLEGDVAQDVPDVFDCFNHIGESGRQGTLGHQNICKAEASIFDRRSLCRMSRVVTSALQPRMSDARSLTSIR